MLIWILIFTFIGSFLSLLIASTLLLKGKMAEEKARWLVAFAAGAMLSAAFFDLLPEAEEAISPTSPDLIGLRWVKEFGGIFNFTFLGIVAFFFLERSLLWYHHHSCPEGKKCDSTKPANSLIVIGDGLHNFLDGITISGAFLISWQLGVVTSLAVFFHEIPHELGNLGALGALGMEKKQIIIANIMTAFLAFLGAVLAFFFFKSFAGLIPYLIAFAAGNFIYIAASDLIPELHQHFEKETAISQTLSFLIGIILILLTIRIFE